MNDKGIALSGFHPIPLFCYFISVMLFAVFTQNPVIIALAFLGGALFNIITGSAREILSDIKFYTAAFLLLSLTNPLFSHNGATPLFFMNDNPVTLEAILCGVNTAAMITGVMLVCKTFSKVMESDKILLLIGKISPKLSTVISMSLRFIPLLKKKWAEIRDAQSALGYFRGDGITDKLVSYAKIFSALVTWALENAVDTSASMNARGYELRGKKQFSLFRFRKNDAFFLVFTFAMSAAVLVGYITGSADFAFYPIVTGINTDAAALVSYTAFAALSLFPSFFEIKEALKWRYLRSKI